MIGFKIIGDFTKAAAWAKQEQKQMKFSMAQALTATSKGLKSIEESQNKSVLSDIRRLSKKELDRPKKQTSTGWFATTAKKTDLKTVIQPKNTGWDREPYVSGFIQGGARPSKWIENTARKLSRLPSNIDLVPTYNTPRDKKYGNPRRGFVKNAFDEISTGKVFIGKPRNSTRPIGIYQISGTKKKRKLKALFVSRSTTSYPSPFKTLDKKIHARARLVLMKYFMIRQTANVKANL